MAGSPAFGAQQAIYTLLSGDATLTAQITGVYDYVPTDTQFPYVQIGDFSQSDWGTLGKYGRRLTATVHTWSRYAGGKQVDSIMSRIATLLEGTVLSVSGWAPLRITLGSMSVLRDPDGVTRHGVQQFSLYLLEA